MVETLGFGSLVKVLMIGLPVMGVVLILLAASGVFQNRPMNGAPIRNEPQEGRPLNSLYSNASPAARYCANCGAGLQVEWRNCPQCGSPV